MCSVCVRVRVRVRIRIRILDIIHFIARVCVCPTDASANQIVPNDGVHGQRLRDRERVGLLANRVQRAAFKPSQQTEHS